jgi:hypothetical protein
MGSQSGDEALSLESVMSVKVLTTIDENAVFRIIDIQDAVRGELLCNRSC